MCAPDASFRIRHWPHVGSARADLPARPGARSLPGFNPAARTTHTAPGATGLLVRPRKPRAAQARKSTHFIRSTIDYVRVLLYTQVRLGDGPQAPPALWEDSFGSRLVFPHSKHETGYSKLLLPRWRAANNPARPERGGSVRSLRGFVPAWCLPRALSIFLHFIPAGFAP